jgi:hypothetical protein
MRAILEVQVLPGADHSERSEAQLREATERWKEAWPTFRMLYVFVVIEP